MDPLLLIIIRSIMGNNGFNHCLMGNDGFYYYSLLTSPTGRCMPQVGSFLLAMKGKLELSNSTPDSHLFDCCQQYSIIDLPNLQMYAARRQLPVSNEEKTWTVQQHSRFALVWLLLIEQIHAHIAQQLFESKGQSPLSWDRSSEKTTPCHIPTYTGIFRDNQNCNLSRDIPV